MKRQILILALACVMIFSVLSFAGCNKELKNQVNDQQTKLQDLETALQNLKDQENKNAANLQKAIEELADQLSAKGKQTDAAIDDLQKDINTEKTTREGQIGELEGQVGDLDDKVEGGAENWDYTTEEMTELQDQLTAKYNAYVRAWVESRLYLTEEYEQLNNCLEIARARLYRATSHEDAEAKLAQFDSDVAEIETVPAQIYNELVANYYNELITYQMRDELVAIYHRYNRWIGYSNPYAYAERYDFIINPNARRNTPAYYDEYLFANGEIVLNPSFEEVIAKFLEVIMPRSDELVEAKREAEELNDRLAAVLEATDDATAKEIEDAWDDKEQLTQDIRAWINEYFKNSYYPVDPLAVNTIPASLLDSYAFELPEKTAPDGTINYNLVDHALYDACVDALYEYVDEYIAAVRKFVTAVDAIEDINPDVINSVDYLNLLSYGKIDVATVALRELVSTRELTGARAAYVYIFNEDGTDLEPDYTESLNTYREKNAAYKTLVDNAYQAYMSIVEEGINTQTNEIICPMMDRVADYYGYTTTDGYKEATTTATNYFKTTSYNTYGYYPVYNDQMDQLVDWYYTYGVWDNNGQIVWDSTFSNEWSWADNFVSANIAEIVENATGNAVTVNGYLITYTGEATLASYVWTVKATSTAGKYEAVRTTKLTADDYAFVTGYYKRTIEVAAEALFTLTPIRTGSESLTYKFDDRYKNLNPAILIEYVADNIEQTHMTNKFARENQAATGAMTGKLYREKYDVLKALIEHMFDMAAEYGDVRTDLDDYHAKLILIEDLNAKGMELQATTLENADKVAVQAIRKLLIEFVGDISAACPAGTAAEKSAVTVDIQREIGKIAAHASAAFDAVVEINAMYEGKVESITPEVEPGTEPGTEPEIDRALADALYTTFRIYILGEQTETQPPKSWLRVFAVEDGVEVVEGENELTGETYYVGLEFPGIERAINDVTAEFEALVPAEEEP